MADPVPTVLVVEDQAPMRHFLRTTLAAHGFRVALAENGKEALLQATTRTPDLVLLDLGLPDLDGVEVTRRLREWSRMPVIVLSARGREQDKIDALDAGADDYLTKPFGAGELLARIRVALRHAAQASAGAIDPVYVDGDLRIDFGARRVTLGAEEVHLTPTEYKLMAILVRQAGRVVTHRQLLTEVWGPNAATHPQYLRVYMNQLRHKLEPDPARPQRLLTEPGVGYRFRSPA